MRPPAPRPALPTAGQGATNVLREADGDGFQMLANDLEVGLRCRGVQRGVR